MVKELSTKNLPSADMLSIDEIVGLLPHLDLIISWAKEVQDYALKKALEGKKLEGYKVVEGRSNRRWKNEETVEEFLLGEGFDEDVIYEKKLARLTKMETILGKKKFSEVLGHLVEKPLGKPTLVAEDDPRPHYSPEDSAAEDFGK